MQEDMGIQLWASAANSSLGQVETELGNFKIAQDYAEKGLAFAQKNSNRINEGHAWTVLGKALGKKEPAEFDKAEEYIRKGIEILDELKLRPWLSQGYLDLGERYKNMGRKDDALKYLKKAEGMFKEMGMDYYLDKTQKLLERIQ